jgi:hypothetical protein
VTYACDGACQHSALAAYWIRLLAPVVVKLLFALPFHPNSPAASLSVEGVTVTLFGFNVSHSDGDVYEGEWRNDERVSSLLYRVTHTVTPCLGAQ